MNLVEIRDLSVTFNLPAGEVRAVRNLSLDVAEGEILGVVGESGCGKSVTFRALLGLVPSSATVSGQARFRDQPVDLDGALADRAALIYQNPGAALNPVFTIGQQLQLILDQPDESTMVELLERVGLPNPTTAVDAYPHEFSGGMQQRAVIAYALATDPQLLIADEPTTALDVTTQAQVLALLRELRDTEDLTIVFISHDLAVIKQLCDRVAVLYAGQVVEVGTVDDVLTDPSHPYTQALLASIPTADNLGERLATIDGLVPDGRSEIVGCAYAERCPSVQESCTVSMPSMRSISDTHSAACVLVTP